MKRRLLLASVVLLALLGVADTLYLVSLKVEDEVRGRADSQVCQAVSEDGCAIALESPMSEIAGVPISIIGGVTYVIMAALGLWAWLGKGDEWIDAALHGIAAGATVYSLVLAGYSASVGSWCVFCIGLYAFNTLMLVATTALPGRGLSGLLAVPSQVIKRPGAIALTAAILAVGVLGGMKGLTLTIDRLGGDQAESDARRLADAWTAGLHPMDEAEAPSRGPKDASIVLIKFSDFQCPYCRKMWGQLEDALEGNDRLRVVFRHNPLSNVCNPMMPGPFHARACQAAFAADCAHQQGKFWEYGDKLFANQADLSDDDLAGYASDVGLDLSAFNTCLEAPETAARIRKDALYARAVGAAGTPSSLINGLRFVGGMSRHSIDRITGQVSKRLRQGERLQPDPVRARFESSAPGSPDKAPRALTLAENPLDLTVYVNPGTSEGRAQLSSLFKLQSLHKSLLRVGVRVTGSSLASQTLACGLLQEEPAYVARELGTAQDPDERAAKLFKELTGLQACVDTGQGKTLIAQDGMAVDAVGSELPAMVIGNKHLVGVWDAMQLDQVVAMVLLAAEKQ